MNFFCQKEEYLHALECQEMVVFKFVKNMGNKLDKF